MFQFEIVSISVSAIDDASTELNETPQRETANFWLCGECAASMTLTLEPLAGLRLQPLQTSPPDAPEPRPRSRELHDC